jgi:hypothetical protein
LRRPSRAPWIAIVVALIVGAAVLVWYWRARTPDWPGAPASGQASAPAPPAPTATEAGPPVDPATARTLLDAISENELVRKGTRQEDVVRRWAVVTDNLAEGVSPRVQLQFLAPTGSFTTFSRAGKTYIAPASYARYDRFGDAVASVNVEAAVAAYRAMRGTVETAYRALGYPEASLDRVTARALRRLVAVPVPRSEVEVIDEGGVYVFADPKLEALGGTEKHLLRMGPRNAGMVQEKARELLGALGFPEEVGAAR